MLLRAMDLWKSFRYKKRAPVTVLQGASLEIDRGEMVAVVGASGSGKSTLLHVLGLLEPPDQGEILFDGQAIHKWPERNRIRFRGQDIGFIFQAFTLLPTLTVFENIRIVMQFGAIPRAEWTERARELLRMVGLSEKAGEKPFQLSGGEQQLVAIARSLANRPRLLLADEPTGNLDSKTGLQLVNTLSSLVTEHGLSVIMVTHNSELATRAHRVCRMRDGQIQELGVLPAWEAVLDPLTGIHNRRGLDLVGEKYTELRVPCALLAFDIDHFKRVNDTYGHKVGDEVLKAVAQRIASLIRREDTLLRSGGEEFILVLRRVDMLSALERAEAIRQSLSTRSITIDSMALSITISVGVAFFQPGDRSWDEAIEEADRYLYQAKEAGRNRIAWRGTGSSLYAEEAAPSITQ